MAHLTSLCGIAAKLYRGEASASRERMRELHFWFYNKDGELCDVQLLFDIVVYPIAIYCCEVIIMYIPRGTPAAVAKISGGEQRPCLRGRVAFYKKGKHIFVVANICGLPKTNSGIFGFHIHEGTSCGREAFADTGSHYNPGGKPHPEHAGDLPPLFACGDKAFFAVLTDRFCLEDVMGRTVVIHSDPDDFRSQPAGNSGRKIACGRICPV